MVRPTAAQVEAVVEKGRKDFLEEGASVKVGREEQVGHSQVGGIAWGAAGMSRGSLMVWRPTAGFEKGAEAAPGQ